MSRSALRFLIEPECVSDGIGENGKCPHSWADVGAWRQDSATRSPYALEGSVMPSTMMYVRVCSSGVLHPGPAHPASVIKGQLAISPSPDVPAEKRAVTPADAWAGFAGISR